MDKSVSTCEVHCVHDQVVERIKGKVLHEEDAQGAAELFKVLGDNTRIRIMHCLMEEELCVCDIGEILGISQSATSHQLRVLRNHRLVKGRKEGKQVFYSLDDQHVAQILAQGLQHISHK